MSLKERAKRLKSEIPAVYLALKDKQTPLPAKILAGITVGYALSPRGGGHVGKRQAEALVLRDTDSGFLAAGGGGDSESGVLVMLRETTKSALRG